MINKNRYQQIIEAIFFKYYKKDLEEINFSRSDIIEIAEKLKIELPKNIGDILYSFRYRVALPESISAKAPKDKSWIIRPAGRGYYKFTLSETSYIFPSKLLTVTKIPDSTPNIITKYALSDEQALLAKLRYNRIIDIFTGIACYSLQSHLRSSVPNLGQVETDEIYVGIDKKGIHYVFPVQAKGGNDRLGIIQIEQDFAVCGVKFKKLICRPIAAQFMADQTIAIFEFEQSDEGIALSAERHYKLVPNEELTDDELENYKKRGL